jgi:hydrogenase nickel incorporation protein HypA/HybF
VHELSLAEAVVETAERHAGGRRVLLVQMRIGELRQVVPESLAFYFEHVAHGTLCDGAVLEYEAVAARLGCRECDAAWELGDAASAGFRCPRCGAAGVAIQAGNEFEVESIEVEEEKAACTG